MLLQIIPILPCIGSNEAEQRSKGPCEISIMPGGKQGKTDKCVCCLQVADLLAIASAGGRVFFRFIFINCKSHDFECSQTGQGQFRMNHTVFCLIRLLNYLTYNSDYYQYSRIGLEAYGRLHRYQNYIPVTSCQMSSFDSPHSAVKKIW